MVKNPKPACVKSKAKTKAKAKAKEPTSSAAAWKPTKGDTSAFLSGLKYKAENKKAPDRVQAQDLLQARPVCFPGDDVLHYTT